MTDVIKTYNLFLDTRNRDSGSCADANFYLVKPITLSTKGSSYFRIKLISATIPFSFTQINSSNNVLSVEVNSVNYSITIPTGNYNILNLLIALKTGLNSLAPLTAYTFNFTYNQSTNKVSLSTATGGNATISFPFNSSINWIGRMLGFTSTISFSDTTTETSSINVNVSPAKTLFVRSQTLLQSQNYESIIGKNNYSDIIGQIPIYQGSQSFINFYDSNNFYSKINNGSIDVVNLYLTDITTDDILLGMDLNIFYCIEIQEVYSKPFNDMPDTSFSLEKPKEQVQLENERAKLLDDLNTQKTALENEIKKKEQEKARQSSNQ